MPITSYDSTPASKLISLPSGGQVTLSFNGNFFQLSKEDREFVYGLLDAMTAYAEKDEQREVDEEVKGVAQV
jgi:hypothetical protein